MIPQARSDMLSEARPVDAWILLTGGSIGLVVALFADLLRLGFHKAHALFAGHAVPRPQAVEDWPQSDACGACPR